MSDRPKRVRVIRVMEYDYPNQEAAEMDMANWGVPPNGVRRGWGTKNGTVIRSAVTFPETMPHEEEEERDDRTPEPQPICCPDYPICSH